MFALFLIYGNCSYIADFKEITDRKTILDKYARKLWIDSLTRTYYALYFGKITFFCTDKNYYQYLIIYIFILYSNTVYYTNHADSLYFYYVSEQRIIGVVFNEEY